MLKESFLHFRFNSLKIFNLIKFYSSIPAYSAHAYDEKEDKRSELQRKLRRAYRCPREDALDYYPAVYNELSKPVVASVVRNLNIKPHDRILEIGFGAGEGLKMVYEHISRGQGVVYGLELSEIMIKLFEGGFMQLISMPGLPPKIILNKTIEIIVFPYPDSFFDGIYHVNVFYFWPTYKMKEICLELKRTLKPGGRLLCGMELKELKNLEILGILRQDEFDPMRYTNFLEPAGFEDVKITYERVDAKGQPVENPGKKDEGTREILLISARKPHVDLRLEQADANEVWRHLEMDIKNDLLIEKTMEPDSQVGGQSEKIRDQAFDMRLPSEKIDAIESPRPDHPINRTDDEK